MKDLYVIGDSVKTSLLFRKRKDCIVVVPSFQWLFFAAFFSLLVCSSLLWSQGVAPISISVPAVDGNSVAKKFVLGKDFGGFAVYFPKTDGQEGIGQEILVTHGNNNLLLITHNKNHEIIRTDYMTVYKSPKGEVERVFYTPGGLLSNTGYVDVNGDGRVDLYLDSNGKKYDVLLKARKEH